MARIYSWQLTDTKYGYITGVKDDNPFIGNRLSTDDYEVVVGKVDNMSLAQYTTNFNRLCELCAPYGLDPTKEGAVSAAAFYDTTNLNSDFMVVLVGKDGKDGAKGEKGDKGDPGEPGVTPDTPIPYISVTAYASSGDRDIAPETPKEGEIIITWNEATRDYTFNDTTKRWWLYDSDANDNDGDGSNKSIIWQSSAIYNDKGIVSPWTKPIRITGENGEPGSDGNNIEFIYTLRTHAWVNPEAPESVNEDKHVPTEGGWTGSPCGIDDKYRYEYMCQRRKNADGVWGAWEGPTVWSRWGDDGKDGDGVEYAYLTTNGSEPGFRLDVDIDSAEYQTPEYRPFATEEVIEGEWVDIKDADGQSIRWYDNPRQIDAEDNRAQWVITRKRRTEEGESKSKWGEFSSPALWSMYGQKGDPGVEGLNVYERKMYQAHNVNDAPEVLAPEKFDPGFGWGTAVPEEKGDNEGIWCIEAYIKLMSVKQDDGTIVYEQQLCWYDGNTDERPISEGSSIITKPRWSIPYLIEGRDGADFVHNREEIYKCVGLDDNGKPMVPELPIENHKQEDKCIPSNEGWSEYMEGLSEETPVCYMCYRDRELQEWWGDWSDWKGPFIYNQLGSTGPAGLDGTDGQDGEGNEYCYFLTFNDTPPSYYVPPEDHDNGNYQLPDYLPYVDSSMSSRWFDEPQGVDAGNPYEWVISRRKHKTSDEVVEWDSFSEPAIYAKYGFNGKDGKDIEYVYCLTKTYEKPGVVEYANELREDDKGNITKDAGQEDEFCPEIEWNGKSTDISGDTKNGKIYWMDNAKDVSLEWPYQWEVIRRKSGAPKDTNKNLYKYPWDEYLSENVTLHSKWGRDGDQGRQGVAGVAGVHYEMRFIRARHGKTTDGLENDDIYLLVPEIANGKFTGNWTDVHYLNGDNEPQPAWLKYWEETVHPDSDNKEFLCNERNLNKQYFPLYTDALVNNEKYPYMFFVQSRIVEKREYVYKTNELNGNEEIDDVIVTEVLENGKWEDPARLTGKQGIQGPEGKRGPILYSAGVYGMGVKYYTDGVKKPYVLDPNDRNYYYLETGNYSPGSTVNGEPDDKGMWFWYMDPEGDKNTKNNTPSGDVENSTDPCWVKMEQFDVILANVGIFRSALVGSGVFYGEWFYSQNGTLNDGTKSESTKNEDGIIVTSSRYEEFDPNTRICTNIKGGDNNNSKEPYIEWGTNNKFRPFLALNLLDGSGWFAGTNILWDSDGNMNIKGSGVGSLGGDAFTWDNENIYINKNLQMGSGVTISWSNVENSAITAAVESAQTTADNANNRMDGWVADGVISKLELQGIKNELAFVQEDYNEINGKCTTYKLTGTSSYKTAYTNYINSLSAITTAFKDSTLEQTDVGDLEKNQENYYSARTTILGNIVTAEQNAISNAESNAIDYASDAIGEMQQQLDNLNDFSQEEIEDFATNITKTTVTTAFVNALGITAKYIETDGLKAHSAYIGELASDQIDVTKLNTTGSGTITGGTISIEGNIMSIYDKNAKEILKITGGDGDTFPGNKTPKITYTQRSSTVDHVDEVLMHRQVGTLTGLTSGLTYTLSGSIDVTADIVDYFKTDVVNDTAYVGVRYYFYYDTSIQEFQSTNDIRNLIGSGLEYFDYTPNYEGGPDYYTASTTFTITGTLTATGKQKLYLYAYATDVPQTSNSNGTPGNFDITLAADTITCVPSINKITVNSTGIQLYKNANNYINLAHDGTFLAKHGNYSLGLDSGGAYKTNSAGTKSYL